jgi:hypothetical protein
MKWKFVSTAALLVLQKLACAEQQAMNSPVNATKQKLDAVSLNEPLLRATVGQNVKEITVSLFLVLTDLNNIF